MNKSEDANLRHKTYIPQRFPIISYSKQREKKVFGRFRMTWRWTKSPYLFTLLPYVLTVLAAMDVLLIVLVGQSLWLWCAMKTTCRLQKCTRPETQGWTWHFNVDVVCVKNRKEKTSRTWAICFLSSGCITPGLQILSDKSIDMEGVISSTEPPFCILIL